MPAQPTAPSEPRAAHTQGVLLVAASALAFSTAGLFTRAIDADIWVVIFWRGVAAAVFTLCLIRWRRQLREEWRRMGPVAWLARWAR